MIRNQQLVPLEDRGPLRVMFLITSMPVGGAETLLVDLVRGLDRERFLPELCCLKKLGPLGEVMREEVPAFSRLLRGKYDLRVLPRLVRLFRQRRVDALVTVGAGDKMFWGRLAAARAGVPVVACALHSTGWPDGVGRLNRRLTRWTDAFIAVADAHGWHLVYHEGFPHEKVYVVPNGIDVERFRPHRPADSLLAELRIAPTDPVAGIVAALRPEKNHEMFLRAAAAVAAELPAAKFLIVGDGPRRAALERVAADLGIAERVRFVGSRDDVVELLGVMNVFALTSHMEANPVSILEAMAAETPVVATRVGSVPQSVDDGTTGYLVEPESDRQLAARLLQLLKDRDQAAEMGRAARQRVLAHASLERMVEGYQNLLTGLYRAKCPAASKPLDVTPPAAAASNPASPP